MVAGGLRTPGGDAARARKALNAATIAELHKAFREGGRAAIHKVMKNQPAVSLKLLVLLVPREMEMTHRGGVKALEWMSNLNPESTAAGAGADHARGHLLRRAIRWLDHGHSREHAGRVCRRW